MRFYDSSSTLAFYGNDVKHGTKAFVVYTCRNCASVAKTYALAAKLQGQGPNFAQVWIVKIGEMPRFGEPRPNLVSDLLSDQIEYFDRGYRSETAGLGIGAFAYYRRFVEGHKNEIIQAIREVAVAQGASADLLTTIDRALKTDKFDLAVNEIKDAIPDSVRLKGGHNPLTLLHRALSGGLHSDDDQECLELAGDIRLVLNDLSERVSQALKDNDKLSASVNRLLNKTAGKTSRNLA